MKKFGIISILLLQILAVLAQSRQNCETGEISRGGEFCLITNLNTVSGFVPVSPTPSKVKEFEIRNASVKHLTPEICRALPNIEKFTASEVGIETLDEDTFKDCRNLKEIRILRNNIRSFPRNIFNRNTNLELLYFGINQLTEIPAELFRNLNKLDDLGFASMNFNRFPREVFKDLRNLQTLWVYHDALLDLDVEDILSYMPRLNKIYLRDNDFKCSRLRTMLEQLKRRNVDIDKTIWEGNERKRDYQVKYVEGVECIDDDMYEQIVGNRLGEPVGNRFDDRPAQSGSGNIQKQLTTLKDAYERKMDELRTEHKAEMDDLKQKLSVMHQNLDSKMTELMTKVDGCHHGYHGSGGYHHKNYMKGAQ